MKVAYISGAAFADVDISYLSEAKKINDVYYYIVSTPMGLQQTAIDLSHNENLKEGLNPATEIPEMQNFSQLLDLSKVYVLLHSGQHFYSIPSIKMWRTFYKYLLEQKFDVYHITSIPSPESYWLFRQRKHLVITVHDPFPHSDRVNWKDKLLRRIAFRFINNIILLNTAQKSNFLKHYHLNTDNVYDSSLSCYSFLSAYAGNDNPNCDYVLFFGNISSYKGVEYLFEAMKIVHKTHPYVKLIVAGKGKYYFDKSHYEDLDYFDIRNRFISNEELATLIKYSRFVVVPYVDATQSGVMMSAYAFNKPCVVTNVGGLPEMAGNGKLGIIVQPRNSEILANAMRVLLDHPEKIEEFSKKIYDVYKVGELSWSNVTEELSIVYNKIAKL